MVGNYLRPNNKLPRNPKTELFQGNFAGASRKRRRDPATQAIRLRFRGLGLEFTYMFT